MNNWNVPWGMPWTGYPPSVFNPTTFPGHVNGLGQFGFNFGNNMPYQPPVLNPGVNGTQYQNLSQPPISVAQPTPQAPTVATPTVNRDNGGRTEQPSTSNASAPRQIGDSAPSGLLVCSDIYIFIVYYICQTVLGRPWGKNLCPSPTQASFYFFTLIIRRYSFWSCV